MTYYERLLIADSAKYDEASDFLAELRRLRAVVRAAERLRKTWQWDRDINGDFAKLMTAVDRYRKHKGAKPCRRK